MTTNTQLESVLFVAGKPLATSTLARALHLSPVEIENALTELKQKYSGDAGIWLVETGGEWQLVTNPAAKAVVEQFVKAEVTEELTRPQLETLTVISYCGPITRPELEQIRGVNCSVILRNLLVRGLVREEQPDGSLLPTYAVTTEYVRHLGLASVSELPQYQELHKHAHIAAALEPEVTV